MARGRRARILSGNGLPFAVVEGRARQEGSSSKDCVFFVLYVERRSVSYLARLRDCERRDGYEV